MNVTCLTCGMNNKIRSLTFNLICNIGNNKLNVISFKKNAKLFLDSLSVSYKRKELDVIVIKVISCEKCEDKIITDKSSCTGYKNSFTVKSVPINICICNFFNIGKTVFLYYFEHYNPYLSSSFANCL